ncbi:MAG: hypothetical protein M0Z42_21590 [Actinomycetota bacterium]|nr:hypothetical protein [Actinomycetota bacterium]
MSQSSSPLETALDLFVFLPVGLALSVGEEVPKLAAKGRARVGAQVASARMIGQFAVGEGRRRMSATRPGDPSAAPGGAGAYRRPVPSPDGAPRSQPATVFQGRRPGPRPPAPPATSARSSPPLHGAGEAPAPGASAGDPGSLTVTPAAEGNGTRPPVASADLAIPGYDSLSASQVVQRLAGLSPDELDAVARYEAAHRGRRTVLARVVQLQQR